MESLIVEESGPVIMAPNHRHRNIEEEAADQVDKRRRSRGTGSVPGKRIGKATNKANGSPYATSHRPGRPSEQGTSAARGRPSPSTNLGRLVVSRPLLSLRPRASDTRQEDQEVHNISSDDESDGSRAPSHSSPAKQILISDDGEDGGCAPPGVGQDVNTRRSTRTTEGFAGSKEEAYSPPQSRARRASSTSRKGAYLCDNDDDDEPEEDPSDPIESFPSPKGKGKARAVDPPTQPLKTPRKMKDRMQTRDGEVPERKDLTRFANVKPFQNANLKSTPWPSRSIVKSSNLAVQPAPIDFAYVDASTEGLRANALTVSPTQIVLTDNTAGKRATIEFKSIEGMELYEDDGPMFLLKLSLSSAERMHLSSMRTQMKSALVGDMLFIALSDENSSHKVASALAKTLRAVKRAGGMTRKDAKAAVAAAAADSLTATARIAPSRLAAQAAERRLQTSVPKPNVSNGERRQPVKGKAKLAADDKLQTKLSFKQASDPVPPRRSTRSTRGIPSADIYREYDNSDDVPTITRAPHLDKHDVLFPYPLEGRTELTVTKGEKYRIEDLDFLNDVALEFGLRYTMDTKCPPDLRSSTYLCSSFFYDVLSKRDKTNKHSGDGHWPAYDAVKKWTKSVNIFDKDFIIVPINESFHWYMAVIINPKGILNRVSESESPVKTRPAPTAARRTSARLSVTASEVESNKVTTPPVQANADDSGDQDDLDMLSMDEGDCSGGVAYIHQSLEEMNIDGDSDTAAKPQPIVTSTMTAIDQQLKEESCRKSTTPEEITPAETRRKSSTPENATPASKAPVDEDIINNNDTTYIITFDSLGSAHRTAFNDLQRWLQYEAREKLKIEYKLSGARYMEAKVPTQPNFSDCGVFLIHYVDCLVSNRDKTLEFVGKRKPPAKPADVLEAWQTRMRDVWRAGDTPTLRAHWLNVINEHTAMWLSMQDTAPTDTNADSLASRPEGSQASVVLATQQPTLAVVSKEPTLPHKSSPESTRHHAVEPRDSLDPMVSASDIGNVESLTREGDETSTAASPKVAENVADQDAETSGAASPKETSNRMQFHPEEFLTFGMAPPSRSPPPEPANLPLSDEDSSSPLFGDGDGDGDSLYANTDLGAKIDRESVQAKSPASTLPRDDLDSPDGSEHRPSTPHAPKRQLSIGPSPFDDLGSPMTVAAPSPSSAARRSRSTHQSSSLIQPPRTAQGQDQGKDSPRPEQRAPTSQIPTHKDESSEEEEEPEEEHPSLKADRLARERMRKDLPPPVSPSPALGMRRHPWSTLGNASTAPKPHQDTPQTNSNGTSGSRKRVAAKTARGSKRAKHSKDPEGVIIISSDED